MAAGGLAGLAFVPGGYDTTGNTVENLIANYNKNQGLAALGRYFQSLENQPLPQTSLPGWSPSTPSSLGPSSFSGGQSAVDLEAAAVNTGQWQPAPDYQAGLALAQSSLENPPAGGPTLGSVPGASYSEITGTPAPPTMPVKAPAAALPSAPGPSSGPSPELLQRIQQSNQNYPRIPYRGASAGGMPAGPPPPQPGQPTVPGAPSQPGQPTGAAVFSRPPTPGALPSFPAPSRVSRETFGGSTGGPPTFQELAASIVKANPGIDPAVLASAVQLASPLMQTDSRMWYRLLQAELQQERLQQQLDIAKMNLAGRTNVAEIGAESRKDVAQIGAASRETVAGENISSREKIAGANIQSREGIAAAGRESREGIATAGRESREGIAAAGREQRASQFNQTLNYKQQALDRNLELRESQFQRRLAAAQQKAQTGGASDSDLDTIATAISEYRAPLTSVSYRGDTRTKVLAKVLEKNPEYNVADWKATYDAISRFTSGVQGDTVRRVSVAENHLQTLDALAKQLGTGDYPTINRAINYINKNFGETGVTNFETARHFVASEVTSAVMGAGRGGALADRAKSEEAIVANNTPKQLQGSIATYRRLMAGQLEGLESQWNAIPGAPKNFKERFKVKASDLSSAPASTLEGYKSRGFSVTPGP